MGRAQTDEGGERRLQYEGYERGETLGLNSGAKS